jgi:hypothetical protein
MLSWACDNPASNGNDPAEENTANGTGGPAVGEIYDYLAEHPGGGSIDDPADLELSLQLTEAAWRYILAALEFTGKYVNLDLSGCTRSSDDTGGGLRSDGTFDPVCYLSDGKEKIVSLTLPKAAAGIGGGNVTGNYEYTPSFKNFDNLKTVIGKNVTVINDHVFMDCTSLVSAEFPAVTEIGIAAFSASGIVSVSFPYVARISAWGFYGCSNLVSVDFPQVEVISDRAFVNCGSLLNINFPKTKVIGPYAFLDCSSLVSADFPTVTEIYFGAFASCTNLMNADFPEARKIGDNLFIASIFEGCGNLVNINFPKVMEIGSNAFKDCISLVEVDFPLVEIINSHTFQDCTGLKKAYFPNAKYAGSGAFSGCTNLTSVDISTVTEIYYGLFANTGGTDLDIVMGITAPFIHYNDIFSNVITPKTVTVRVPAQATGYDAEWQEALKLRPYYNGIPGTVNEYITLNIVYQ